MVVSIKQVFFFFYKNVKNKMTEKTFLIVDGGNRKQLQCEIQSTAACVKVLMCSGVLR